MEKELHLNQKASRVLNYLLVFFFVCSVFLWFKDNIQPLKKIQISYLIPLIPLIGIALIQSFFGLIHKKTRLRLRWNNTFWAALILILLALAFRIPFLMNSFGLMTSDDAIPALMAKHIAEGKLPSVYYYGQFYMGSVSQHIFALVFTIFGYSIPLLKFTTLLFYLAFIVVQFLFMKDIFFFRFSFIISLFYCLPIGELITVSFDNTGAFPLVLLLGSLILYFSYLIHWKNKDSLIPLLGFLMGISFWTHQITISFILTSAIVLLFKYRLRLQKYLGLIFFFLIGCFPLLMQELYERLLLLKFFTPEGIDLAIWAKLKSTTPLFLSLVSLETHPTRYLFLACLLLGFLILIYTSVKERKLLPQSIFSIFFAVFFLIYVFSDFSKILVTRYLYPVYFCLPVLLVLVFTLMKSRKKHLLALSLILILFFPFNLKHNYRGFLEVQNVHSFLNRVLDSMIASGKQYWRGNYWTSYLLTALSKENIIVDSTTVNRYYPYTLSYDNDSQTENYVFLRGQYRIEGNRAVRLIQLLEALNIELQKEKIGEAWLVYDVRYPVSKRTLDAPLPSPLPSLVLSHISSSKGHLYLKFQNNETGGNLEYRINVEIPGYSSVSTRFMLNDKDINVRIPFPKQKSFKIKYYVGYQRLKVASTVQEIMYYPTDDELEGRRRFMYLSGFRPAIEFEGKELRVCEKVAKLEFNNIFRKKAQKIKLYLYSPFEFSHPYWYGDYFQQVRIEINGSYHADKTLRDGLNVVEIGGNNQNEVLERGTNTITLRFKYHLLFEYAQRWKISALLEKIETE